MLSQDAARASRDLGEGLLVLGRPREAGAALARALAEDPDDAAAHSRLLVALNYRSDISSGELLLAHQAWDERHGRRLRAPDRFEHIDRDPDRRLRVGYVSFAFREHASSHCREPLLGNHDHERFEVFCYADGGRPDALTRRFQGYADHWIDIDGWSAPAVADRIRADRIDLLVDLVGHFGRHRLEVFARRPAPVQIAVVYPSTTGLSAIDYRIVDAITDPAGADAFCRERLIRLPRCILCYRPHPEAGPVMPLPARRSGQVTFGSLNWSGKITPEVVSLWARVLRAVPRSRLFLKSAPLGFPLTQRLMLAAFAAEGIGSERLRLEGATPSPSHFAAYGDIDIALDPSPYNGAVTSLEALWMGAPLVSVRGDRHAARVGASLLIAIGLRELIAETTDDYVDIAARLASDLDRLAQLRAGLRDRMRDSPLCDGAGFAREFERAYRTVWRRWCASDTPVSASGAPAPMPDVSR